MSIGSGIAIAGVWLAVALVACSSVWPLAIPGAIIGVALTETVLSAPERGE